ncbi:ClpP/crotonase-like domain-containing protein [Globomyces pollinis-pini]|nr:ClpP/crotonase-like domain-containing protein [Globomyces pollinis-pini]
MPEFLKIEIKKNFAIVSIKRDPVNSMHLPLWKELAQMLSDLESNEKVRGLIITSGLSRPIFTAGNDLTELHAPKTSHERYTEFWRVSNTFLADLSTTSLVTVAAIHGACPAGGCCLSMCCDYRIATDDVTMGLNEVALGIPVPAVWIKLMSDLIGKGKTDKIVQFAIMVPAKQCKEIGLIDEIVSKDQLIPAAETLLKQLLKLPDPGRAIVKGHLRNQLAAEWTDSERLTNESDMGWSMLSLPSTVKALDGVFARLAAKPKL